MRFQILAKQTHLIVILSVGFSFGCGGEDDDSSSSGNTEALRSHLRDFSQASAQITTDLGRLVDMAAAINDDLQADDFASAQARYDVYAAEIDSLRATLDILEAAEEGIEQEARSTASGDRPYFVVRKKALGFLVGVALFTYGTKKLMDWMKTKADESIAAKKAEWEAQDDIANGVEGAEERHAAAKKVQKDNGLEVINTLGKKTVSTAVTSVASPVSVAGVLLKEGATRLTEAGLDVLSATQECKGGINADGCAVGATKTDSAGTAAVPSGTVDICVSKPGMARVEVIEQVAVDGAEVPITKTPIEDATPSTVSAGGDGTTPPVEGDTDTGSSTGHPADTGTPDDTGTLCSDTCMYAGDGECDDGGPGALWAECALGSDCSDCGVREAGGSVDTDSGDTGQDTAVACSGSGAAGSYPDGSDDFNGLQVSYAINGVCLDEGTDSDGFTITRSFPVWGINGSSVTVSGSVAANDAVCNSDYGSFWFQTDVSLTVGGVSDTFSSPEPCTQSTTERYEVAQPAYTFDLSVPVSGYGDSVSFSISQTYVNPRFGDRGVVVSGNTSY